MIIVTGCLWGISISTGHLRTGTGQEETCRTSWVFNEMISNLGLQEILLKGRSFTWSNMQENSLLEQIDW
jgi:hypothetical protein